MTDFRVFHAPAHDSKHTRAPRKGDAEWTTHRAVIEDLYMTLPLKHVIETMRRRYGFIASRRQYEYHLAQWKVSKYNPRNTKSSRSRSMTNANRNTSCRPTDSSSADLSSVEESENGASQEQQTSAADPEWLSNFFTTPMLWDSTSLFIEQELAAFNDKNLFTTTQLSEPGFAEPDPDPLAQFVDCHFVDQDRPLPHAHSLHTDDARQQPPNCEHQWQPPGGLSRLWELETPASQRTGEQHYRVQKLIWCLWLCGNHTCFTNLARGVQYRIVRVEDDIWRFEGILEKWIATSLGCPESMVGSQGPTEIFGSSDHGQDPTKFVSDALLQRREGGVGDWHLHAKLGHHLATLKATGRWTQATKLMDRLRTELKTAPGNRGFFMSFSLLLWVLQKVLSNEIASLRALDPDVRLFIGLACGDSSTNMAEAGKMTYERRAIGILALLCHQRWSQSTMYTPQWAAAFETKTGFPIAKAFQWALRLLLFRSSNDDGQHSVKNTISFSSLSPSALCSKALNGLSALGLAENPQTHQGKAPKLHERLAVVWLDWLSRDRAWFLPLLLPPDLADTSMNIWQSVSQ